MVEKRFNVYALKTADGSVYVGSTSMPCERRWKNGNGFLTCAGIKDYILRDGWNSIQTKVVVEDVDKAKADRLERLMLSVTASGRVLNPWDGNLLVATEKEMAILSASGVRGFLGDSVDKARWKWQSMVSGMSDEPNESVICVEPNIQTTNNEAMKRKKQTKKIAPMQVRTVAGVKMELSLDTRRIKNDGQYPVTIRLYKDKQYKHIQTGYAADPNVYPHFTADVEAHLNKQFERVAAELTRQAVNDGVTDIYTVERKGGSTDNLADIMREKAALMTNAHTRANYGSAIKLLLSVYPDGLECKRVCANSIKAVLNAMGGYKDATKNIYLSIIKASVNFGIYKGYLKAEQYPFRKSSYELDKITLPKSDKRDDCYLTADEMNKVLSYFNQTKDYRIGMFLFSYTNGGMNLADLLELKFDDFYFTEGGFRYIRQKTAAKSDLKVCFPYHKWSGHIFKTLGIEPKKGRYVFEKFANRNSDRYKNKVNCTTYINKALARMCRVLHFAKKVSMTFARHSFCTIANRMGMPYTMSEYLMGHTLNGVTSHYMGGYSLEQIKPWCERLLA